MKKILNSGYSKEVNRAVKPPCIFNTVVPENNKMNPFCGIINLVMRRK